MTHYRCSVCGDVFCYDGACVSQRVQTANPLRSVAGTVEPEPFDYAAIVAQLDFIRAGGETERYHTQRTIQVDTVGHHSFNVAWLVVLLNGPGAACRGVLLMAALAHDLAEHKVGDIPAPSKRMLPDYPSTDSLLIGRSFRSVFGEIEMNLLGEHGMHYETLLTPAEIRTLKMADGLDGMLFCVGETSLGNRRVGPMFANFRSYVDELGPASAAEVTLYSHALSLWEKYSG